MADHPAQPVRGLSGSMQVLLLGIACLLLQQVTIHYRIDFFGYVSDASLIHLHTGLLLAIAMLVRDARVVAACFLLAFIGWALRQIYLHDDGRFTWTADRADDWRKPPGDHVTTRYQEKRLGDCAPVFLDFIRR